jgi:hypothetical protein
MPRGIVTLPVAGQCLEISGDRRQVGVIWVELLNASVIDP